MTLQAEDFEFVARNLALGRYYPDEDVLKYTIRSLERSPHENYVTLAPMIRNELSEAMEFSGGEREWETESQRKLFMPGRVLRFRIKVDEKSTLGERADMSQIASFWAFIMASERIRFGKRVAFTISSCCAAIVLAGMFVCLFSDINKALILVCNFILLTIALESGLAGVLFQLKLRAAKFPFDKIVPSAQLSAFSLARKAKNVALAIALFLLFVSFSAFCVLASSGNISALGFVISYTSLSLALECGLIAALFQLKQGIVVDKLEKMTDQMCAPTTRQDDWAIA